MEIFGYKFRNPALLEEALTTPSFRMTTPGAADNQRLEFLGDAVLDFLAADRLYAEFPDDAEGPLTVKRTHMVSSAALCEAAARSDLAGRLRRNKGASPLPPGAKVYADAIEAILGAAWLDGGLDAARRIFDALDLSPSPKAAAWDDNPKGYLQTVSQAMTPPRQPEYTTIGISGKAHAPIFTIKVKVEGLGEATASSGSRKDAESAAAAALLRLAEDRRAATAVVHSK